jgi:Aspartyl protease
MKKNLHAVKIILVEFEEGGCHIFVNLLINGKRCRFLIDTGASKTVIDKGFFEKHFDKKGIKTVKQETSGLHGSVPESHFAVIQKVGIGKLEIKQYQVAAIDLNHVNSIYAKTKKPKIHGILGSDLMLKHKMVIDYGNLKMAFN